LPQLAASCARRPFSARRQLWARCHAQRFAADASFAALVRREIIRAQQVNNPPTAWNGFFSLGLNIVKVIIDVCGHVLIIVPRRWNR